MKKMWAMSHLKTNFYIFCSYFKLLPDFPNHVENADIFIFGVIFSWSDFYPALCVTK